MPNAKTVSDPKWLDLPLREFSCADIKLLDLLQRNAFNYFVQNRDEYTRLPLDRSTAYSPASISAPLSRPQRIDPRLRPQILAAIAFRRGKKPPRIDVELSIVDTALFCLGVICVKEYFNQGTPRERVLRELANQHICRPRWDSLLTEHNLLRMGWKPETGMLDATFKGFNEGLLLYLVALGSPTHRIPDESWRAQLAGVQPQTDYGETFLRMHDFPLFGYHYPLCWFDFRELFDPLNQESGFDYFENAQRAVRAQYLYRWHRAWCCGHCTSGLKNARFCLPKQALSVLSI